MVAALLVLGLGAAGCVSLPRALDAPSPASRAPAETAGRTANPPIATALPARVIVLGDSAAAFRARHRLIAGARRSIDLQTFEWHPDGTSRALEDALVAAARRGVRVRLLIDDFLFLMPPKSIARLDAEPNIALRSFNPHRIRSPSRLVRIAATATEFRRLNRRMHAKSLVVDRSRAILGGRNVSDRFSGRHRLERFRDLEVELAGPVAARAATAFDTIWKSRWAVPARRLLTDPNAPGFAARPKPDRTKRSAARIPSAPALPAHARFLADDPGKNADARTPKRIGRVASALLAEIGRARRSILLASGYLYPTPAMLAALSAARARSVRVTLITGGLATTDQIHLFTCYARQRPGLLAAGIRLREYRRNPGPFPGRPEAPSVAYHTKAAVFDGRRAFVGSLNFDQRSAHDNLENGVILQGAAVARRLARVLMRDASPDHAWRVERSSQGLRWTTRRGGRTIVRFVDPDVTPARRALASAARLIPVCGLI